MAKTQQNNIRAQAALKLAPVFRGQAALRLDGDQGEDSALLKELCYGSTRLYPRLYQVLNELLQKPLKNRDADIKALLIIGLYQLFYMRVPDHAVLDQSVRATLDLNKKWARGLVNAVLRNALRRKDEWFDSSIKDLEFSSAHPKWLADQITDAWPTHTEQIFAAGNERPPMILRVNNLKVPTSTYAELLGESDIDASPVDGCPTALKLAKPVSVSSLPGFAEGLCSVQDEAAQWCAQVLAPASGNRVLDACAAPGGKTGQLLEQASDIELLALDIDETRTASIQDNLNRLNLSGEVLTTDAADTAAWWDGKAFDRILIDAPCSGTGVIRRHPDIKLLRRPADIGGFAKQQARLLDALWPLLAEDGLLLYVTCSIMPAENEQQILTFLQRHPEATLEPMDLPKCLELNAGKQSLPAVDGPDGFYFALLRKS